jgi:hypothetical protein
METSPQRWPIRAIYWKKLTTAERRQLGNVSNADDTAGGGARDLRCRPSDDFHAVLQGEEAFRDKRSTVYRREVRYNDERGDEQVYSLEYSVNDPDAARANELRIRVAGTFPPFKAAALTAPPAPREYGQDEPEDLGPGEIPDYTVYFVQQDDGRVFGGLLTREQLSHPDLEPTIKDAVTSRRQGGAFFA